jgi:hypothetical protein
VCTVIVIRKRKRRGWVLYPHGVAGLEYSLPRMLLTLSPVTWALTMTLSRYDLASHGSMICSTPSAVPVMNRRPVLLSTAIVLGWRTVGRGVASTG